jgi:hypothetical protein
MQLWRLSRVPPCVVFFLKVSQTGLFAGVPALVQRGGFHRRGLFFQLGKYLLDNRRVFDAGDDFHYPAAVASSFDVDVEHTLEPLRTNRARHSLYGAPLSTLRGQASH